MKSAQVLRQIHHSKKEVQGAIFLLRDSARWYLIQSPPGKVEAQELEAAVPHLEHLFLDLPGEA